MKPALCCIGLIALACEARPVERPSPATVDKQAVFGSASLVPTREGERARRELAIAGELEQALAQLGLGPAHVDVELREKTAVIVIAKLPAHRSAEQAEAIVAELVGAMIPAPTTTHVWWQPAIIDIPAPARVWPSWTLLLCCIGLGLSLGVTGERLRSRW